MIGRIVWIGLLAAIAVVTAGLQIDMQSRRNVQLAGIVPAPLRNHAQLQQVRSALADKTAPAPLSAAKELVLRRPVPADSLILLAASQAKAGETEAAARTIQIAGQRGWREPVAQEAVLRIALGAGDQAEAARRYAALFLRQQTPDAVLKQLGPAVLSDPGGIGRKTMVAIVIGGERWHQLFLQRGAQVMPPAAFTAIIADSLRRGAAFDCAALAESASLIAQRDAAAAAQLRKVAAPRCPDIAG